MHVCLIKQEKILQISFMTNETSSSGRPSCMPPTSTNAFKSKQSQIPFEVKAKSSFHRVNQVLCDSSLSVSRRLRHGFCRWPKENISGGPPPCD